MIPVGQNFANKSILERTILFWGICIPVRIILTLLVLTLLPVWAAKTIAFGLAVAFAIRAMVAKEVWWNRWAQALIFLGAVFSPPIMLASIVFGGISWIVAFLK